jgi:hypothetical protein
MRSALMSPRQYRDFAAQCLRWAAHAKHEEHKSMMLQMAEHWMQMAEELERAGASRSAPSRMPLTSPLPNADRKEERASED